MLKSEGVNLPVKASGYLLYRQVNLDKESDAKLTTWLQGDYSLDTVLSNLRRLDRVTTEGKKGVFFEEARTRLGLRTRTARTTSPPLRRSSTTGRRRRAMSSTKTT